MNPPTPPPPPPPSTSGGQDPPPSPLKLGKESLRPGPKSFKTGVIPSSHTTTRWKYDFFLSFSVEDSRKNFIEHLYHALVQKGMSTCLDEKTERGIAISPVLLKGIEESQIVIVVFSANYANSPRCLDELAKVVECRKVLGQKVFPVFYDVYPYEVRTQTGYFGKAFSKHEQRFKDDGEKIGKWRAALTEVANLSGWDLRHGNEAKGIRKIVEGVYIEINSTVLNEAKGLVGIESRVQQVLSYLDMSRFLDVRVIGISGIGGIGKTTIAQAVFERIRSQFDACSFLANVREVTKRQAGLVYLQQKLLSDTMPLSNANIYEIEMGIDIIKRRLRTTRVLIILDDVDQLKQLEALCGPDWFGPGSRIIITSRDRGLLSACKADEIYDVGALTEAEALQLFRWKCFNKGHVEENISELSKKVVEFSRGLPLAIEVLGPLLQKTGAEAWKRVERKTITDVLKASYDGLSGVDKKVFLDIACFFNGEDRDRVTRILESCGLDADTSIEDLMVKSLVTLSGKKLGMHDLIQEMGHDIVGQECQEPGKRSRLWRYTDIIHVLTNNEGTSTIEGIFLNLPEQEEVELTIDPFLKMRNLKYLKVRNVNFSGNLEYLCDELRLLDWHACPLKYLPSDFQSDKLVELIMQSSHVKQLWSGVKSCNMLKLIDLSDSQYLIETPDLTGVPNIETLVLEGCTSLIKVHRSIGVLKKLVLLNMRNCSSVQSLPPLIGLESLEVLILSGCSGLDQFPRIEGNMESLLELHLDRTAIVEVPEEIKCLTGLSLLNLEHCENLLLLPNAIEDMSSLKRLNITGCSNLSIPEDLSSVECLEEIDISGTALEDLSSVECLEEIDISGTALEDLNSLPSQGRKFPPLRSCHQHIRDFLQNLRNWNMMEGKTPNGGYLYSSTDLISNNYNNSVVILITIFWVIFKLYRHQFKGSTSGISAMTSILSCLSLYQIYCISKMDYRYQFKGSTSGVSATTSCESLIDSLPLTYEGIVDPDKESRGKEADWLSSELSSPIEQVARAQEAKQEETSKSQRGKELMEFVPSELFCPSSKKKEPYSPIEPVQKAKEEDEMEKSNNAEKEDGNKEDKSYLFLYCSLFPSDYEFRKHELVQLWIAEGFNMEERHGETMEDAGLRHFDSLESKGFFKQSRCDFEVDFDSAFSVPMYSPSSFFYKVNPVELSLLENSSSSADSAEYFRAVDSKLDGASESTTKHLSLIYEEDINEMIFGVLPKFKNLRTLLLLSGHGSSIKRVPGELFMSLNILTTLNLSRTLISGLPSSIGNVQQLRYLDVSYTLITRLPESIGSLNKLQTLKLRGCKDLFDLPRRMHRLTALRHLDFDIIRQLDFMPAHLGNLRNLQSLSAFLVGRDDGRRIGELENLNDLGGALRIFRLENVLNKADAEEVDLENKKRLQRLDFRWTKLMGEKENKMQEEILDSLRPPTGLKELQILFYSGTKFPSWLSDTSITDLVVITLYKCANCKHLPSLGRLPNLKFLSIVEMNAVEKIAPKFFRSLDLEMNEVDYPKSLKAFPKLEILEVDSMLNLKAWEEIQEGDLESLIKLTMESCPELVTVPSFSDLKSLKYLEFNHCPKLLPLDRKALPTSLESLIIRDCPKLKESWPKEGHQDLRELKSCS